MSPFKFRLTMASAVSTVFLEGARRPSISYKTSEASFSSTFFLTEGTQGPSKLLEWSQWRDAPLLGRQPAGRSLSHESGAVGSGVCRQNPPCPHPRLATLPVGPGAKCTRRAPRSTLSKNFQNVTAERHTKCRPFRAQSSGRATFACPGSRARTHLEGQAARRGVGGIGQGLGQGQSPSPRSVPVPEVSPRPRYTRVLQNVPVTTLSYSWAPGWTHRKSRSSCRREDAGARQTGCVGGLGGSAGGRGGVRERRGAPSCPLASPLCSCPSDFFVVVLDSPHF